MRARGIHNQGGFTLAEAMVATMILTLALGSVLGIAGRCMRYISDIRRSARGSQVLQQKMEDVRLMSWSQIKTLPGTFTDPSDTRGIYQGTILTNEIDYYPSPGSTTLMRVTLTVSWTNQTNRIITNQLSTLISQGGLNKYIF